MRRLLIVATVLTLASVGLVVAYSAPATGCTKIGSSRGEPIAGTARRDVICARGGADYVAGLSGPDVLRGDGGRDTMVGGRGDDLLLGAGGRDKLFAVDNAPGDTIRGGADRDKCFADRGDVVTGCENTFRGVSMAFATSLSNSFGAETVLAEELISAAPTVTVTGAPGPAGPPGPTGPVGNFPPCTPPPNIEPDPLC